MHTLRSVLALAVLGLALLIPARVASAQSVPLGPGNVPVTPPGPPLPASFEITPITGTVKVLVVGCYFSDTDTPSSLLEATVGIERMYGPKNQTPTITQYFDRVSNGKLQIEPTVKGWYKLPSSYADYATNVATEPSVPQQETDCKSIARGLGADDYRVVVMLFNADTNARNHSDGKYIRLRPWGGHGGWINQATHVHEIGHALGLPHSHTVDEKTDPYSNPWDPISGFDETSQAFFFWNASGWCDGYWDGVDLNKTPFGMFDPLFNWMEGKGRCIYENTAGRKHVAVHYSAFNKVRLGRLSDHGTNTTIFYGGDATYRLQALGSHNYVQQQMLAVPIDKDRFYAVEYRKRDADYYEAGVASDGLVIYRIDGRVNDDNGDGEMVKVLQPGQSFSGEHDITITAQGTEAPDFIRVAVSGPIPAPAVTALAPNYGSSTRNSNIGWLPLTVNGTNFVPSSAAEWNGSRLDGQQATGGPGFVDSTRLTVRVPDSLLRVGQSAFVSVTSDAPGFVRKSERSPLLPFFVSPSGAETKESATDTRVVSGPIEVKAQQLTATANGTGSLAAATFTSNPGSNANFLSTDRWFSVLTNPGHSFDSVTAKHCDVNGGTVLRWWTDGAWKVVQPAATLANNCLSYNATNNSRPSLYDVSNGALFAVARTFTLGSIDVPTQVNEGQTFTLSAPIINPSTDQMNVLIEWGDGRTGGLTLAGGQTSFSTTQKYLDNPKGYPVGGYRMRLTLTDRYGAIASVATKNISVANVAPKAEIRTDVQTEAPGNPVTAYVKIIDPGVVGTDGDTVSADIDWGDGGPVETIAVPIAQVGFAAKHVYSDHPAAGTVTTNIRVTLTDDDGGKGSASTPITLTMGVAAYQIWMCDDSYYNGRCRIYREKEIANMNGIGIFNDTVSSIKITGPGVISVYEHFNFYGKCETFSASDPWLGDNLIGNDAVSSVRVGVRCP